jgi:hypothetical protein
MTAIALALAAALWVKLPTPPLLMAALGLCHVFRREWRRAGEIFVTSLLGLALFGFTFSIYAQLTGYQWAYFGTTFGRASTFLNVRDLLARFPQGMGIFVLWLSMPLSILVIITLASTVRRILYKQAIPADALGLYVAIVGLFYPLIYLPAWGYPRYQAPIVPILSILVAALLAPLAQSFSRREWITFMGVTIGFFAFNLIWLPDPLYPMYQVTFEGDLYDIGRRLQAGLSIVLQLSLPMGAALLSGLTLARIRRAGGRRTAITILAALAISSLASTSFVQINADYSTRYRYTYAYADYLWSVQQMRAMGASAYILAIKDTLYESGLAGEEIYAYLCDTCSSTFLEAIRSRQIDALAWTTKEDVRGSTVTADPLVAAALDKCYRRSTRGVFIVYQLKSTPCNP